jgi:hypothetical protein
VAKLERTLSSSPLNLLVCFVLTWLSLAWLLLLILPEPVLLEHKCDTSSDLRDRAA